MKRWLAVTVTGAVMALGTTGCATTARAAEPWAITAENLLKEDRVYQESYFLGVMDGFARTNSVQCPETLRKGTAIFQARVLLKEHPRDVAIENLVEAMGQLGCKWTTKPTTPGQPIPSGPSS